MDKDYITSERFIWDGLKEKARAGLKSLYETWRKRQYIDSFIIGWPAETVLDDRGLPLTGTCLLNLDTDSAGWPETLRNFSRRTKAYALLLTEQKKQEVLVILESHHGTRSWSLPILTSGDLRILGEPQVKDDTHSIGILWRPQSTSV